MSSIGYVASEWGKLFHSLPFTEVFGAGAAGPGKSMVLLFDPLEQILLEHSRCMDPKHPHKLLWGTSTGWALHLRRETPMLQETIERSLRYFPLIDPNADYDKKNSMWKFSSGYKFQFGHCQNDEDWGNFLSKQYTHIAYDELTQFNEEQYHQINSRIRSSDPMLKNMLKIRACSNPFCKREKGQNYTVHDPHWVRKRFVDPDPNGRTVIAKTFKRGDGTTFQRTRMYLPATLYDNPDKEFIRNYEENLLDKPPHIRQAMLYGDWYVTVGSHYAEDWIREVHTCSSFKIPASWRVFRAMDWGYKHWGTIGWYAIDEDGTLYKFREFSFRQMDAREVAKRVAEAEKEMGYWHGKRSSITGPADTQLWEERGDTSMSKAREFAAEGISWLPANKKSRARNSQLLVARLKNQARNAPNGIVIFRSCKETIRTLPGIQTDPNDLEAPAEGGDDHWHDETLYACSYAQKGAVGVTRDRARERYEDEQDEEEQDSGPSNRGRYGYGSSIL